MREKCPNNPHPHLLQAQSALALASADHPYVPDGNRDAVYETFLQEFQFCMYGCILKRKITIRNGRKTPPWLNDDVKSN